MAQIFSRVRSTFCLIIHSRWQQNFLKCDRAGSLVFLPGVFGSAGLPLHDLGHEAAHGFRRLILHLPGGVGIGAEGEARIVVTQHTGDRLDIYPVLEGQRGEGMPLRYNNGKRKKPLFSRVTPQRDTK